jgi:murein DD-endopeptidase MepM/ murein hydrolase activator NlpD
MSLRYAPEGDVTQYFSENPSLYAQFELKGHNGIDLVRPHGEKLFAIEDADVVEVKDNPDGFGKYLRFVGKPDKDGICNEWTYGHNSVNHVKQGDVVEAGQHIADMGNTGFVVSNSNGNGYWKVNPYAGTHLHLGLRKMKRVKSGGFLYPGSTIRLSTQNYSNGYKGAVDPVPVIAHLSSNASAEHRSIFQKLLTIQSIINSLKKK